MNTKAVFLDLIAKNDGQWTWYQLERGLNARGMGGRVNTIGEIQSLIDEGLITEKLDEKYPNPFYCITEKGKLWLQNET